MATFTLKADAENPLSPYRLYIAQHLLRLIEAHYAGSMPQQLAAEEVAGWIESNKKTCDFALPLARFRLKGAKPGDVAESLAQKFPIGDVVASCEAQGTGLTWQLQRENFNRRVLENIVARGSKFGNSTMYSGKTVICEYSSPNIAKLFHAGHLRSTVVGNFLRNVQEAHGANVVSINYLGDWGKQYGLLAVGYNKHGSRAELEKDAIKHLFDVYVQINKDADADPTIHDEARSYFKRMEDGDKEALALWEEFRDLSIVKYKETYKRINIDFDVYSGESQVTGAMEKAMEQLKEKKLLTDSDGALVIDLKEHKAGVCVVQKKDGTSLYITRDIGAAAERYERYKFDEMYYIVASQQDLHFKQLFKTLELMRLGEWTKNVHHVNFGMIMGMSTRRGNAVFLQDLLDRCQERMHEVMKTNEVKYAQVSDPELTSDILGISAIVVNDMSAKRHKDYEFDWDRCFQFEGDTGPFLQYSHARMNSILVNYASGLEPGSEYAFPPKNLDLLQVERLGNPHAAALLQEIARFPDLLALVTRSYEPCNVLTYLFGMCHRVSAAYDNLWVQNRPRDEAYANAFLYWCVRTILHRGITLLGLTPLERM